MPPRLEGRSIQRGTVREQHALVTVNDDADRHAVEQRALAAQRQNCFDVIARRLGDAIAAVHFVDLLADRARDITKCIALGGREGVGFRRGEATTRSGTTFSGRS